MSTHRKNYYRSIKLALQNGRVVSSYERNGTISFLVKYFKPIRYKSGWSLTGEWYECTEIYFERVVKKHPNYY